MLPIEARHLHIADHQVEGLPGRAVQRFAAIQQHFHLHPFVFEHVGDQAGHGRLIFHDQHARTFPTLERGSKAMLGLWNSHGLE